MARFAGRRPLTLRELDERSRSTFNAPWHALVVRLALAGAAAYGLFWIAIHTLIWFS